MATKSKVLSVLEMLSGYYSKEPTDAQINIYLRTLTDIPDPILEQAAYDWIAQSQFFPRVNELRSSAQRVEENDGRTTKYQEDEVPMWVRASSLLSANLRGIITDDELEKHKTWKAHIKFVPQVDITVDDSWVDVSQLTDTRAETPQDCLFEFLLSVPDNKE